MAHSIYSFPKVGSNPITLISLYLPYWCCFLRSRVRGGATRPTVTGSMSTLGRDCSIRDPNTRKREEQGRAGTQLYYIRTQLRHQEESSRLPFIELAMRAGVVDLLPFCVGRGLAGHSSSRHQRAPSCITGSVVFQARDPCRWLCKII